MSKNVEKLPPVTLLVVEDSALQKQCIIEEMIEKFTGEKVDFTNKPMNRTLTYPGLTIHWCGTYESAEALLQTHTFDAAMIDIGFPQNDLSDSMRMHGNHCGLQLVE